MNLTIDSNVQNIIFNGNDVQKLIFNGVEVWSKVAEIYENYGYKYLTFEFTTSGTWGFHKKSGANSKGIYYRKNSGSWTLIYSSSSSYVNVNSGDIIEVYSNNSAYTNQTTGYNNYFDGTSSFNLYGNIRSLIDGIDFMNKTAGNLAEFGLCGMFINDTGRTCNVIDASNLIFDFSSYSSNSLAYTFYNNTNITNGPIVLGTASGNNCMGYMFYNCTNLVNGPKLFSLTLGSDAYKSMFYKCSKLNYIEAYFTTTPGSNYTNNWMYGVQTTSGTFVKNSAATWNVTGVTGVPTNWTKTSQSIPYAFYLPYGASEVSNIVGSDTLTGTIYLSRDGNTWYGKKLSAAQYQDAPTFMSGACAPYNQMFTDKGYTVGNGRLMTTEFNISETGNNLYVKVDNGGAPFMLCFMGSNGYSGKRVDAYKYGGKITSLCSPYWYVMDKFDPDTVFVFGKMFATTADDSYTLVIDKNTTI